MNSQSILPASCTSSCLMLMIWSSRARNRSADPVVSCFFGRIAPSDAATESCFSIRGNRKNECASFQGLRHGNLAISSQQSRQNTTLAQWVRNSSRATTQSEAGHSSGQLRRPIPPWRRRDLLAPPTAPTHGPSLLRYRAKRCPETYSPAVSTRARAADNVLLYSSQPSPV